MVKNGQEAVCLFFQHMGCGYRIRNTKFILYTHSMFKTSLCCMKPCHRRKKEMKGQRKEGMEGERKKGKEGGREERRKGEHN